LILLLEIDPVVSFEVPVVSQPASARQSRAAAAAVKIERILMFTPMAPCPPVHRRGRGIPPARDVSAHDPSGVLPSAGPCVEANSIAAEGGEFKA
ncbi:MAG: hypothetical protein KDJ77_10405, partial [Rhodobiaceae bacterium]|nr:hypothetical protein [Rhodobiaceae bacterium]